MSVKTSSRVWEYSPEKGSNLLALLAIADHADDYGVAWPGMSRIAKKARVSERQTKRIVQTLQESGELYVKIGGGRGHSNRYFITTGLDKATIIAILTKHSELELLPLEAEMVADDILKRKKKGDTGDTDKRVTSRVERVTSRVERVTSRAEKGDIAMSPEPSVTVNEPSDEPPCNDLPLETEIAMLTQYGRDSPGIANPMLDLNQWVRFRDDAIQAVKDITGEYPNPTQQAAISDLTVISGFDMDLWEKSIHSCQMRKVKPGNVSCYIDTYHAGGDYGEMCRQSKNGAQNASHKRPNRSSRPSNRTGPTAAEVGAAIEACARTDSG